MTSGGTPPLRRAVGRWLPWGVAIIALFGVLYVGRQLDGIQTAVEVLITQELEMPQQLETQWRDALGVTHKVVTPRLQGETPTAWATRHQEGVTALQAIYPPVSGS
jgi:hypothetical protein